MSSTDHIGRLLALRGKLAHLVWRHTLIRRELTHLIGWHALVWRHALLRWELTLGEVLRGRELALWDVLLLLNTHCDLLEYFRWEPACLPLIHVSLLTNGFSRDNTKVPTTCDVLAPKAN